MVAGDNGEDARRERYERLYAEYRDAQLDYEEARSRGAHRPELVRLRARMLGLWERLAAWRLAG